MGRKTKRAKRIEGIKIVKIRCAHKDCVRKEYVQVGSRAWSLGYCSRCALVWCQKRDIRTYEDLKKFPDALAKWKEKHRFVRIVLKKKKKED